MGAGQDDEAPINGAKPEDEPLADEAAGDDLRQLAQRVNRIFAFPPDLKQLLLHVEELSGHIRQPYDAIGKAFCSNVHGLVSTISIPYQLASATSRHGVWQSILMAERIRALTWEEGAEKPEGLTPRREEKALSAARSKLDAFLTSEKGVSLITRDTLEYLDRSTRDNLFAEAVRDLLFQGLVLTWSTFEVLARDCFIAYLNINPTSVTKLLNDPVAKRRFDVSKVSLDILAGYDFNLSSRLGDFLAQQQDLSDFVSIKAVYCALFPENGGLKAALSEERLRLLSQGRSLTVHKRAIVDGGYIRAVPGCNQAAGERLMLTPQMLDEFLESMTRAAGAMLDAVATG